MYPPYNNFTPITVGADPIFPNSALTHAIWVGTGGGNMTVIDQSDNAVTFSNVISGQLLYIAVKRVSAVTGTVANLMALRRV